MSETHSLNSANNLNDLERQLQVLDKTTDLVNILILALQDSEYVKPQIYKKKNPR
jgi:hypothetical protein